VQVITRPAAQLAQQHHQGVLNLWRAAERSEGGLEKVSADDAGCRSAALSSSPEGHAAETHTPNIFNDESAKPKSVDARDPRNERQRKLIF